jgi:hypothetical protein
MPVIPATWEVKVGESQCEAGLGKSVRPYLKKKKKTKAKWAGVVAQVHAQQV